MLQYQYRDGNNYHMNPGYNTFYTDHQVNAQRAYIEKTHSNINYAKAVFYAKCGSNDTNRGEMEIIR